MCPLASGLPETISDEELLVRFIFASNWFNTLGAKPAAFLPNTQDHATSVFRLGPNLTEEDWRLGANIAGTRTLHGAASVKASIVREAKLDAVASEPPPRHANILRWETHAGDPALEKAKQKDQANVLARAAAFVRR